MARGAAAHLVTGLQLAHGPPVDDQRAWLTRHWAGWGIPTIAIVVLLVLLLGAGIARRRARARTAAAAAAKVEAEESGQPDQPGNRPG